MTTLEIYAETRRLSNAIDEAYEKFGSFSPEAEAAEDQWAQFVKSHPQGDEPGGD